MITKKEITALWNYINTYGIPPTFVGAGCFFCGTLSLFWFESILASGGVEVIDSSLFGILSAISGFDASVAL